MLRRLKSWAQSAHLRPLFYCNGHCRQLVQDWDVDYGKGPLLVKLAEMAKNPAQADLLVISGPLNQLQAQAIKEIYHKMISPKWVLAIGDCLGTKSILSDAYALKSLSEIEIDVWIKGCPPTQDDLEQGLAKLHEKILRKEKK